MTKFTWIACGVALAGCTQPAPAATAPAGPTCGLRLTDKLSGESGADVFVLAGNGFAGFADGDAGSFITEGSLFGGGSIAAEPGGTVLLVSGGTKLRRWLPAGQLTTVVGNNFNSQQGFNVLADVAVSPSGQIAVVETGADRVQRVDALGRVFPVAGGGQWGYADGAGPAARFNQPNGIAADAHGNLFVADTNNNRIRKIDPSGRVTTVAGNDFASSLDGPASVAQFNAPSHIVVASDGTLYVSETYGNRIRKIDPAGNVTTLAGGDRSGAADGPGNVASFGFPEQMALDSQGNLYVVDQPLNSRAPALRRVTPSGFVTTLTTPQGTSLTPNAVTVDAQDRVVFLDAVTARLERLEADGSVTVLAGDGSGNGADGPTHPDGTAQFGQTAGIVLLRDHTLVVADPDNHRLRHVDLCGHVTTYAGSGAAGFADGPAATAKFANPAGLALDDDGNVLVADTDNQRIRKVAPDGTVSTLAGNGIRAFADGPGAQAKFADPVAVATDHGTVVVADRGNRRLRRIAADGTVSTLNLDLDLPSSIAVDAFGSVILQDPMTGEVHRIALDGTVTALRSEGGFGPSTVSADALQFQQVTALALDPLGRLLVASSDGLLRFDAQGNSLQLATVEVPSFAFPQILLTPATAVLGAPAGLASDGEGNVFVSDTGNHCIRVIVPPLPVVPLDGGLPGPL